MRPRHPGRPAYAISRFVDPDAEELRFQTLSGLLTVKREGELYSMDFPAYTLKPLEVTDAITEALGARPKGDLAGQRPGVRL